METTSVGDHIDNNNTTIEAEKVDEAVRQRELEAVQALTAGFLENLHKPTERVADKLAEIQFVFMLFFIIFFHPFIF